jgi:hypothetical protein
METILLECEYFPCIAWYHDFLKAEQVLIEQYEYFVRASLRNRCYLQGPHGKVCLSVPIEGGRNQRIRMKDVRIASHDRWQHIHWQTILSNYGRSPYFLYFSDELKNLFSTEFSFLMDLNLASLDFINKVLRVKKNGTRSESFEPYEEDDKRLHIRSGNYDTMVHDIQYHQVFSEQHGFFPNLSMLDFIFCENDLSMLL